MKTIELAVFELKAGSVEHEFQLLIDETNDWLALQPGFIRRQHGVSEEKRMDYVEWESPQAARDAGERFMSAPETRAFLSAIRPDSVMIQHFQLIA